MECLLRGFMIRDGLLCFASPKRFSLTADKPGSVLFLSSIIFLHSHSARRVLLWRLPGAAHVDPRALQSDFLWRGRNCQRTEPSSPSLLEASLKVKRNNPHGWSSRPGSPRHLQRVPVAQGPWFTPKWVIYRAYLVGSDGHFYGLPRVLARIPSTISRAFAQ